MNITAVTHQVHIGIDKSGKYVTANPYEVEANQGDKFRARSDKGKFRLVFKPWPFTGSSANDTVDTEGELTFERLGKFEFYCYLTPTGSTTELAYRKGDGGNGIVR